MRAALERNGAVGSDAWGTPVAAAFASTGEPLPCFIWSTAATETVDGTKTTETEDFRALFALGADVKPGDEVASVTNRKGTEIIAGRLRVEGPVQRKHTHLEANLRRIA